MDSETEIFSTALDFPEQIEEAVNAPLPRIKRAVKVCICGMGNSALAGDVLIDYANASPSIPITVIRDIELPGWVDSKTTVILLSYSGDSDEVILAYDEARARNCKCIVISAGGKLGKKASENGDRLIEIKRKGMVPREAFGIILGYLAAVLESAGVCDAASELRRVIPELKRTRDEIVASGFSEVKDISGRLLHRIPVVYSLATMRAAAIRWKTQINENSKFISFCGSLPEFNHNEIVGWMDGDDRNRIFIPVIIYDNDAPQMVRCMLDASMSILEDGKIDMAVYHVMGESNIGKNLTCILMGDLVSLYLAHLRHVLE